MVKTLLFWSKANLSSNLAFASPKPCFLEEALTLQELNPRTCKIRDFWGQAFSV